MKVVVIGGGTAGITVLARLQRALPDAELVLIDRAERHYYQPLWTLVGGGLADFDETDRSEADFVPAGVEWIHDYVEGFLPEQNEVVLQSGARVSYDQLVVAPGLRVALDEVKGLVDALENDPRVWTNYDLRYVGKGPFALDAFAGGDAYFTTPDSPLKCGGAPQKIMWIAEETLRRKGVRNRSQVTLTVPADRIFGVPKYRETLDRLAAERDVHLMTHVHLIEIDWASSQAVFENLQTHETTSLHYDLLHVTPPQRSPDFIRTSVLAGGATEPAEKDQTPAITGCGLLRGARGGFVDVDIHTLQHKRFPNIWSLGDAADLPTAKTGAAVRKQAPLLVENLKLVSQGQAPKPDYDGYTSCPLVVGHDRVVLAEFGYDGKVMETFPFDQGKPRYSAWLLKRHLLPQIYWHGMLRGWM